MTAIIGVFNYQGLAIAADSAVTVTGNNIKKVYNKSNKLFTLSKYHPIGIAVYNSSEFMGIPWETLIKMYRKQLKDKKFDTVEKYKKNFLSFLSKNLGFITSEFRESNFYTICRGDFQSLKLKVLHQINQNESITNGMSDGDAIIHISPIISKELEDYKISLDLVPQNRLINITLDAYVKEYSVQFEELISTLENDIKTKHPTFSFTETDKDLIKQIFYSIIKVEYIFEQSTGLVFIGFGEKEVYPSSHEITIGSAVMNLVRYKIHDPYIITPAKHNAEIISYAQRDVTMTILKGIDPTFQNEIDTSVTEAFNSLSEEVALKIPDPAESANTKKAIQNIPSTLIAKLEQYRHNSITQPLIDILNYMGKEDMAELAESLVSITSLKRKFTPSVSDESVGGPVDVAVITKGDGFVWIKRKNYFDFDLTRVLWINTINNI